MTSEQLFDLQPLTVDNSDTSYYVFYNEWDGEITSVSRKLPTVHNDEAYICTSDEIAKKLLRGEVNERDYIVTFLDDDTLGVMERDDKLRLRSSEKTLHQLTKNNILNWDIRVKIFLKNNKLLLEINPNSISKLTKLTFKKELLLSQETDLDLYLTKYNDPNFFLEKLVVDPAELLDTGNILYDISHINQYININDIGVLTRRCFKNYYVEVVNDSLNILQNSLVKSRSFIHERAFHNFSFPHISIEKQDNTLLVKLMVSVTELEDHGVFEKKLKLYVVGDQPDEFYGEIHLDIETLKQEKQLVLPIDADLNDINLLYNKRRLIISIKDQPDA